MSRAMFAKLVHSFRYNVVTRPWFFPRSLSIDFSVVSLSNLPNFLIPYINHPPSTSSSLSHRKTRLSSHASHSVLTCLIRRVRVLCVMYVCMSWMCTSRLSSRCVSCLRVVVYLRRIRTRTSTSLLHRHSCAFILLLFIISRLRKWQLSVTANGYSINH